MDNNWERSVPMYKLSLEEANKILQIIDKKWIADDLREINIGCRNSNYIATTNIGPFFLRISPPEDGGYKNEKAAAELLKNMVKLPSLYYSVQLDDRVCLIYEYIEGLSMQHLFTEGKEIGLDILKQVAQTAAAIHRFNGADAVDFEKLNLPPFETWYDLFLSDDNTAARLGADVVKRVQRLVEDKESKLPIIERYRGLIHCDFRPANMLINSKHELYVVDWEFAGMGHILADIGQFFRYRNYFSEKQLQTFEEEYNQYAAVPLPEDWEELSRLRDLINPLQMIGGRQELPLKYEDLKGIVLDTLMYFGY